MIVHNMNNIAHQQHPAIYTLIYIEIHRDTYKHKRSNNKIKKSKYTRTNTAYTKHTTIQKPTHTNNTTTKLHID